MGGMIPTRRCFDALGVSLGSVELVKNGPPDPNCANPRIFIGPNTFEQQSDHVLRPASNCPQLSRLWQYQRALVTCLS